LARHLFAFPRTSDNEVNAKPQNVFRRFGDRMATGYSAVKRVVVTYKFRGGERVDRPWGNKPLLRIDEL